MRATYKMKALEALDRIGPTRAYLLADEAKLDGKGMYTALERWLKEGLVSVEGDAQDRIWSITEPGREVAKALRRIYEAEPL